MIKPVRILGITGSLRRKSYNRAALRAAVRLAPEGATIDIFEIDGIPPYSEDDEPDPPARVVELKRRIREADVVLFVTPEYNYSIPGVLKNAIDRGARPYGDSASSGKPAAVMGASTGAFGTARAQYHLRQVMDARRGPRALRRRRGPDPRGDEGDRAPAASEPGGLDATHRRQAGR